MVFVKAQVIWLPKRKIKYIKQNIQDNLGFKLVNVEEKVHHSDYYEEDYNIFNCDLDLPQSSGYESLIYRWCKQDISDDQKWLLIKEMDKIFPAQNLLVDRWIDICNMSFGTMVGLNKFVEHYGTEIQNSDQELDYKVTQLKGMFEHDCKEMRIYFVVVRKGTDVKKSSAATHRPHYIKIEYSDIKRIVINRVQNSKTMDVYFHLIHPPLIFIVQRANPETRTYENWVNETPDTTFTRVPMFADCSKSDVGLSTVLRLQFVCAKSWDFVCHLVKNCNNTDAFFSSICFHKLIKNKVYHSPRIANEKLQNTKDCKGKTADHFSCVYALQCVLSRSRDIVVQIDLFKQMKVVVDQLTEFAIENPQALEKTLFEIFSAFERSNIIIFNNALKLLYQKYNTKVKDYDVFNRPQMASSLVDVRRAVLTPTRIIYLPPQPYFKCRFFREFEPEYAIRLSVRDDNIEKLSYSLYGLQTHESDTMNMISSQLLKGFKIGKRHYKVLGCSSSHLRDHGIMLYADDSNGRTAETARQDIGKLDVIKQVSKYMARMGQAFSQALNSIEIDQKDVAIVEDICPETGKMYIFSDGIGLISDSLAKMAYEKLDIKFNPSAIQIRYAGCKGMLTLWPESYLKGKKILFRESMQKFVSESTGLEILKTSKPRLVYLNRPFITILSQMGITDQIFLNLQRNMLEDLLKSFMNESDARDLLKEQSLLHLNYDTIYNFGIEMLHEPFFQSMIQAIFRKSLELIKSKARILIPQSKGRTMFGVLDETLTLEYGQVFVQYTNNIWEGIREEEDTTILEGTVLVTKNPCMYPGDVRKFQAIDVPELHHIKDCIVFPAKGSRPHPNEMAGSDLDGDEYSVVWMDELIFTCENFPPADFPSLGLKDLNHKVTTEDMIKFFCKYIRSDRVGKLAIAHLVWADCDSDGIFSKLCLDIAAEYCIALDSAKTGIFVEQEDEEDEKEEEKNEDEEIDQKKERKRKKNIPYLDSYPDFEDKKLGKNTYLSKKILGQLYRCCKTLHLGFDDSIGFFNNSGNLAKFVADPGLDYPGKENYEKSAKIALKVYSNEIENMLEQYGVETEGELLSGAVTTVSKYISIKQDLNDLTLLEHRIKLLMKKMRINFIQEFIQGEVSNDHTVIEILYNKCKKSVFQKASAWYMATYTQTGKNKYFGLPWVIYDVLSTLKVEMHKERKITTRKMTFERQVNEFLKENFPDIFEDDPDTYSQPDALGIVFKILHKWLSTQIIGGNYDDESDNVTNLFIQQQLCTIYNEVRNCPNEMLQEETSIAKTLIHFLQKLSCLMFQKSYGSSSSLSAVPFMKNNQLTGLLAFKAFLRLLCTYNMDYLDSKNSQATTVLTDTEIQEAVFRIAINNDKVADRFIHNKIEVKELLIEWTNVQSIEYRDKQDRKKRWYILITVKGNKYSLHHFQNIIMSDNFDRLIIESIPSFTMS